MSEQSVLDIPAATVAGRPEPGATLHYEVRGAGPVLLLICGGHNDAGVFTGLAGLLADRYTVVTYDPRGNSRSALAGPPGEQHIETHGRDAHLLLRELGGDPAYVFGSSSGALVGLELAARHPEQVRALVAHEPPAIELIPERDRWHAFLQEVYELYTREGAAPAMATFGQAIGMDDTPVRDMARAGTLPPQVMEMGRRMTANIPLFLENELRSFTRYVPDIEALRAVRVVLAGGRDSRAFLPYEAGAAVAERLGLPVTDFPGDHAGYIAHTQEFAQVLDKVLSAVS